MHQYWFKGGASDPKILKTNFHDNSLKVVNPGTNFLVGLNEEQTRKPLEKRLTNQSVK